jgi:hypothetical protein
MPQAGTLLGPFCALGGSFTVETVDLPLSEWVTHGFVDLRDPRGDSVSPPAVSYRVERAGPAWHHWSWSVLRDDVVIREHAAREEVLPTVLNEVFDAAVATQPAVRLEASTLTVGECSVLVVGLRHDLPSTLRAWWDDRPIVVRMLRRGASLISAGLSLVNLTQPGRPTVEPYWRPMIRSTLGPDAHGLEGASSPPLVPISTIGRVGIEGAISEAWFVAPVAGERSHVEHVAAAEGAAELAWAMRSDPTQRRQDFQLIGELAPILRCAYLYLGVEDLNSGADLLMSSVGTE